MNISPINLGITNTGTASALEPMSPNGGTGTFGGLVQRFVADTNVQQTLADQAVQRLATGQTDSVHETMLAMAKADLSFRIFVEVQSKVVEAYQEVMRMQM